MNIQELHKMLLDFSDVMELNAGCTKVEIDTVQKNNDILFPTQFVELLLCFNGGEIFIPGTVIFGINKECMDDIVFRNEKNYKLKFNIPSSLLIFGKINYGDLLCLDLGKMNEVVQWDHERGEEFCRWTSLEDWLLDTIQNYEP